MDFAPTPAQVALRRRVVELARSELNGSPDLREREREFPRGLWERCGELRLQGLPVAREDGGAGLDAVSSAVALEALGYACEDAGLVFAIGAHLCACTLPLARHGSADQRRRLLPSLARGALVGAHAMTERGSGSDAFAMATRAEREGEAFRLTGEKRFVTNGPVADVVLVFALSDAAKGFHGGVTAFLLEKGLPGLRFGPPASKMGLSTASLGDVVLDGVLAGPETIVGGVGGGAGVFGEAMDWERVLLFASQVGVMERLLEGAIAAARSRTRFGQAIGKFQAVSHRIADMKVRLEAARLLVYKAAWALERSGRASLEASVAKLFVSEALVQAALDAQQMLGAEGYLAGRDVERAVRDALASPVYSGTSEMQRNLIARWLGL